MNLGRNQLLGWINQLLQCEYRTIESLADGVAYCQLLDAIHPNSVNFTRLNLSARYPDDCLRNLRILESGLKKLRINQPASFEKMSQGKFQDNILFLQWLYGYYSKNANEETVYRYEPYAGRIQIMQRQGRSSQEMCGHLVPARAFVAIGEGSYGSYEQTEEQYGEEQYHQNEDSMEDEQTQLQQKRQQLVYKITQLKEDTVSLEGEMKTQMETNWKLMHNIQRSIEERNSLFLLLKQIETIVKQADSSSVGAGILSVINQMPEDFVGVGK